MPRGDGTFLVKPGKLIIKEQDITVKEAAAILQCSVSHIYYLIDVENVFTDITQRKKKARIRLKRAQVEALARRQRTA